MPINYKNDDVVRLTDITRAAVIMAQGIPLTDVHTTSRGSLIFIFDNRDDRAKVASAAIMNNTPIKIGDYLDSTRKLREIISTHLIVANGADAAASKGEKRETK
jgi:hypothetical protein